MLKLETTIIEGYRIIKKIGQGGMAIVYLAENAARNPTRVAIKVLDEFLGSEPEYQKRFKREAYICSQLSHPNIVKVFNYGCMENSQYILMEYVDGKDLGECIKNGRIFSVTAIVNMILYVASGLEAAHQKNVIHRDLKPQNILLTSSGIPKITDFGIAKIRTMSHLTEVGEKIMGTTLYMSPEQIKGSKDIDIRSDIYSLGVVFYELLAGYNPYNTNASTPPYTIMNDILFKPPPPIRKADIPDYLITIVNKCMAKDRVHRFKNTAELINSIKNHANQSQPPLPKRPPVKPGIIENDSSFRKKAAKPFTNPYFIQHGTNERIYLNQGETLIGRSDINHIIIEDMYVSKNHARIYYNGLDFVIEDLDSRNGTYVNDLKISTVILNKGDVIRTGRNMFIFRFD